MNLQCILVVMDTLANGLPLADSVTCMTGRLIAKRHLA